MAPKHSEAQSVYLLPLTDGGAPDVKGTYIYLPPPIKPYIVRFIVKGTSSITRKGSLWTNIPAKGEVFCRQKFKEHP
jgi:glycogen debranching enzyme